MQLTTNFTLDEFQLNGNIIPKNMLNNLYPLVEVLQAVRNYFHKPIIITSGYRSPFYNKLHGGATNSYHTKARAADFYLSRSTTLEMDMCFNFILQQFPYATEVIYYPSKRFIHLAIDPTSDKHFTQIK